MGLCNDIQRGTSCRLSVQNDILLSMEEHHWSGINKSTTDEQMKKYCSLYQKWPPLTQILFP